MADFGRETCKEVVFSKICKIFKITELKRYQEEAFCSFLNDNDCFLSQPTGYLLACFFKLSFLFIDFCFLD